MKNLGIIIFLMCFTLLSGCVTMSGNSVSEKRQSVMRMKTEVLTELFELKPSTQSQVANAAGYAVFSNINVNLLIASFGGGYGVVKNNSTGKITYMNMGEVGLGIGAGLKDFRVVFIFESDDALKRFIQRGWAFGGQVDAAAKLDDKGGAVAAEVIIDNVTIYQLTKSGLALQATLKGTKFWLDSELN
ncbi:MAG: hypothetical protein COA86_12910 [Kangiella sp.]|nr:MAG: hypothetical protein COA86_12910 [Kangiella sp.]